MPLDGPWQVHFDPHRGGPDEIAFEKLEDWSQRPEDGVRHYSGTATYRTVFNLDSPPSASTRHFLDLGRVEVIAEVALNGKDLGILWKPPLTVEVTAALRRGRNELVVKVTNLWPNRLIGDEQYPDDCTPARDWRSGPLPAWPEWFMRDEPRPEPRRLTFTTWKYHTRDAPLLPSGLLGPVTLQAVETGPVK